MQVSTENPVHLSDREERLIFAMQLLGDKTRYRIFKLMLAGQELCVSQIAAQLDISSSAVSQHFRHFEQTGMVSKQRDGQRICYSLREDDLLVSYLINLYHSQTTFRPSGSPSLAPNNRNTAAVAGSTPPIFQPFGTQRLSSQKTEK
ncbi:hypothetical protein BH23PAT1_BH23PAT1_2690 [soil metagenome]